LRQCDIERAEESWYLDESRVDIRERNLEYLRGLGERALRQKFMAL
jgi:hypothetical protein